MGRTTRAATRSRTIAATPRAAPATRMPATAAGPDAASQSARSGSPEVDGKLDSLEAVKPPLPEQQQEVPGTIAAMEPRPDHGEESYRGHGRLQGKKAVITGGDSGIGRAVAIAYAREGADVL